MANTNSSVLPLPLAPKKENIAPIGSKMAELSESRAELLNRLQCLKQDLQTWRMKVDTQVKIYQNELSDLKKSLHGEVEQLRADFQELRTTLQQQQEDVTASLQNLGLQDSSVEAKEDVALAQDHNLEGIDEKLHTSPEENTNKKADNQIRSFSCLYHFNSC